MEDSKCNLGWRITARHILDDTEFETLLKKTHDDTSIKFSKLLQSKHKKEVNKLLSILRAVRDEKQSDDEELDSLLTKVNLNAYTLTREYLRDSIKSGSSLDSDPGIRKTHIIATTVQSSKGLAADYVFITHFDDQYYVKDKDKSNITDQDICKFLVALTRARKKAILISSDTTKTPIFLQWIAPKCIQKI